MRFDVREMYPNFRSPDFSQFQIAEDTVKINFNEVPGNIVSVSFNSCTIFSTAKFYLFAAREYSFTVNVCSL